MNLYREWKRFSSSHELLSSILLINIWNYLFWHLILTEKTKFLKMCVTLTYVNNLNFLENELFIPQHSLRCTEAILSELRLKELSSFLPWSKTVSEFYYLCTYKYSFVDSTPITSEPSRRSLSLIWTTDPNMKCDHSEWSLAKPII